MAPSSEAPGAGANVDAQWAFARYEAIRERLPTARFPAHSRRAENLEALAGEFDVFILDAFGVLNVGETAVPGAPQRVAALEKRGKAVFVLTNGATYDESVALEKYRRLGFAFKPRQIVASRALLHDALGAFPGSFRWGVAAAPQSNLDALPGGLHLLADDRFAYEAADGFVLLSSLVWDMPRQNLLVASLLERPRPVLVGNPDLVAPREDGLSLEPGFYAHDLADRTELDPVFFGKPYGNAFDEVLRRLASEGRAVAPRRIAVVGDTLHTDVLGGAAAGFKTVLVRNYGLYRGLDAGCFIARSGIVPDFVIPAP
ncbi:MAG TPA: HAD hydrolase-like protein [Afifellaceae bacterium]|nr:HAD hydrolase-like protein [Afifellaceae bacterium]